jgi:uncharacterized lipoprotein YddW (UPF0748 family)
MALSLEDEGRALWVIRTTLTSKSSIDKAIEYAVAGGFHILFVQAVGRGDAFYPSSILPMSELLKGDLDFDPLRYFLDRAHKRGLEVHVWVNLLYVWSSPRKPESPRHIVHRHSDWMVRRHESRLDDLDRDYYLSPAMPDVRAFLVDVIAEIIDKYPVDGVHLDYIRYPTRDSGFEEYARQIFFSRYYIDPVDLFERGEDTETLIGNPSYPGLRTEWYRWRARQVTDLLREIRKVQRERSPKMTLSAAVIPHINRAREIYGQDWVRWANDGLLDIIVTMSYSPKREVVLAQSREAKKAVRHGLLYVGLAVYNQSLDNVVKCVKELRSLDIDGISIFSYNSMLENPSSFKSLKTNLSESKRQSLKTRKPD